MVVAHTTSNAPPRFAAVSFSRGRYNIGHYIRHEDSVAQRGVVKEAGSPPV